MTQATRTCIDCGTDITARHSNAKRCETCSASATAKATSHHRERSYPCEINDSECVPGRLRKGKCDKHYRRAKGKPKAAQRRTCLVCREEFVSHTSSKQTCSIACYQYARMHPGYSDGQRSCPTCGADVDRRRGTLYCSTNCRSAASKRRTREISAPYVRYTSCVACGSPIASDRKAGTKYCSDACGDRFYRSPERFTQRFGRTCERCGVPIPDTARINRRFCTVSCQVMQNQDKRRTRKRGLPTEDVSRAEIFERDNMTCHLCGYEITDLPTIDHIVPISHPDCPGHVWENLAAAHSSCNIAKRDRVTQHDFDLYDRLSKLRQTHMR